MTDAEIEAFADFIHDAAIQYANGHETDFRPVARRIAEASRHAALEEAAQRCTAQRKDFFRAEDTAGEGIEACADAIRALAGTET